MAMGKGSTQHQHLMQTEVPKKLLEEWLAVWAQHYEIPGPLRVSLRPHRAGSELLELGIRDEAEEKLELINSWRPEGKPPVRMVYRIATETTAGVKLGVDGVIEYVQDARKRGIEGIVIDTNFDTSITDGARWLAQLEELAGALE